MHPHFSADNLAARRCYSRRNKYALIVTGLRPSLSHPPAPVLTSSSLVLATSTLKCSRDLRCLFCPSCTSQYCPTFASSVQGGTSNVRKKKIPDTVSQSSANTCPIHQCKSQSIFSENEVTSSQTRLCVPSDFSSSLVSLSSFFARPFLATVFGSASIFSCFSEAGSSFLAFDFFGDLAGDLGSSATSSAVSSAAGASSAAVATSSSGA